MIKVFLVEDEIIIRNGIKNSINWEMHGYDFVGEASDGELALPMILEKKPDILITDIKMPFMDGLELSEQVKKVLPATKIMILSVYNEFDYAKMAIKIGVTDYLLKPISSEKLLDAVNKVAEEIRKEQSEKEQMNQYAREMQENKESIENIGKFLLWFFNNEPDSEQKTVYSDCSVNGTNHAWNVNGRINAMYDAYSEYKSEGSFEE